MKDKFLVLAGVGFRVLIPFVQLVQTMDFSLKGI